MTLCQILDAFLHCCADGLNCRTELFFFDQKPHIWLATMFDSWQQVGHDQWLRMCHTPWPGAIIECYVGSPPPLTQKNLAAGTWAYYSRRTQRMVILNNKGRDRKRAHYSCWLPF